MIEQPPTALRVGCSAPLILTIQARDLQLGRNYLGTGCTPVPITPPGPVDAYYAHCLDCRTNASLQASIPSFSLH
jgi:hypothetical protein